MYRSYKRQLPLHGKNNGVQDLRSSPAYYLKKNDQRLMFLNPDENSFML